MKSPEQFISSLTVDVEEYYHASNLDQILGPRQWHKLESRVERSTHELLDIFDEFGAKGTFFALGSMARRHPGLINEIVKRGHELASHGYGHRIVSTQSPKSFYRDVRKAKLLLEDQTGQAVLGYRAPNFSIVDGVLWAYDELTRAGYKYDSSLHPVRHPRYGNIHRSAELESRKTAAGELIVMPLSVLEIGGVRIGISGGGWWRQFPKTFIWWGLARTFAERHALNCYLHPWEMDPGQPRYNALPLVSRLRHYRRLGDFAGLVRSYLNDFGSQPLQMRLC